MDINTAIKTAKKTKPQVHDIYQKTHAPKESKGFHRVTGNEIWGYVYSPELFVKSDATGRMCRYYIQVDDKIFHPDELAGAKVKKDGSVVLATRENLNLIDPIEARKKHHRSFENALHDVMVYRHPTLTKEELSTQQVTILDKTTKCEITMARFDWVTHLNKIRMSAFANGWPTFSQFAEMIN